MFIAINAFVVHYFCAQHQYTAFSIFLGIVLMRPICEIHSYSHRLETCRQADYHLTLLCNILLLPSNKSFLLHARILGGIVKNISVAFLNASAVYLKFLQIRQKTAREENKTSIFASASPGQARRYARSYSTHIPFSELILCSQTVAFSS